MKKSLAIFASGGGSNAQKIIAYFENHATIQVVLILTNKSDAGVIKHAIAHDISYTYLSSKQIKHDQSHVLDILSQYTVDYLILAGYLALVPKYLIENFQQKILNIHPSLLPKFGGKGMYGYHVHQAVIDHGEAESGMTIHLVDEEYDSGKILYQAKCPVYKDDTAEVLAARVLKLEHNHYGPVIEEYLMEQRK